MVPSSLSKQNLWHNSNRKLVPQNSWLLNSWTLGIETCCDTVLFSWNSGTEKFWGTRKCCSSGKDQTSNTKRCLPSWMKIRNPNPQGQPTFFPEKNASDTGSDLCPCISNVPTNPHPISLRYVQSHPFSPWVSLSAHGYFLPIHMLKTVRLIWQLRPKDKTFYSPHVMDLCKRQHKWLFNLHMHINTRFTESITARLSVHEEMRPEKA